MSNVKTQDSFPVTSKPWQFQKGHDSRRQPGGLDPKTKRVRRQLARLDGKAMEVLADLFASDDPDLRVEALKFWAKYRLPVPSEKAAVDLNLNGVAGALSPEVAAKLAALEVM